MRAYVPEDLLARLGPRRLDINIDGAPAAPAILDRPGYHDISRQFQSHGHRSILIAFQLDKAVEPDSRDERERGLVIVSLSCE